MSPGTIATVVLAAVGVLSLLGALVAWLVRRGGDERAFAVALGDATEAVKELTREFRLFRDEVIDKLHGLDIRVTRLEIAPPPIHVTTKVEAPSDVSSSPDRDASPAGGHRPG